MARGARVTVVELGPELAAVRSSRPWASSVDGHVGEFEDFAPDQTFDTVMAFTCGHWYDGQVTNACLHEARVARRR